MNDMIIPAAPAPTISTFFFLGALDAAPLGFAMVGSNDSDECGIRKVSTVRSIYSEIEESLIRGNHH
jgi:hypothetical protein